MSRRQSPARSGQQSAVRTHARAPSPEAIRKAWESFSRGERDQAESLGRSILNSQPDHAGALVLLGIIFAQTRRSEQAAQLLGLAAARLPNDPSVHNNYGNVLRDLGRHVSALTSYERALALKPDYLEAHYNRAVVLQDLRRFEDAIAGYDQTLALKPGHASAHNNRGAALQELGRCEAAVASYDQAIAAKPDYAAAHNNRGTVLAKLQRFEQALASYERAITLRPDYAEALSNRGLTLHELKRFDEALASYERAITLRPNHAETHNNLGLALMQLGRLAEARASLKRAVELDPRRPKYQRDLGDCTRYVSGDPHLEALEKLAEDSTTLSVSDRIELHFALAKAYEDLGRHTEAFTQWLDGNALKRRQITYDEAVTLGTLDQIGAVFTTELMRTRHDVGNPSTVPIFIVGMARSGSTLVEQILASHPQVFGGGELMSFPNAVNATRTKFGPSATFPGLVSGMAAEDYRDLGARYFAELERLAPGATRITDKMPVNFMFAGLIHLALPNAVIIHTSRDPVDTCLSCFSKLFIAEQNHTYDLAELGRYYRHYQALMAHWHRVLPPGRILDVRYEDVVADLQGEARRIIAHCRLDWDPRCLAFHQTERPVLTASAAQVREPIYSGAIGRWRAYEPFLGPLLAELG